jgi:hypothetical protein
MPIQPLPTSHIEISVTEPISPALERVKQMLFKPFDLGKWFTIGFCAWLAMLGESGGGFSGNYGGGNHTNSNSGNVGESFRHGFEQARDFTLDNLYWIVPAVVGLVIFLLALWLLILWLSSRGKFMFLHCVALDKAEVGEPWGKFSAEAGSLFKFRIVLGLAGMVLMLPPLIFIVVAIIQMVLRGEPDMAAIIMVAGLILLFVLLAIVFALVHKFTVDFVVPIMFLRRGKCLAAWKEFYALLVGNAGHFALYILFQIVLGMAIGVITLGAILITCCLAGCLMLIPYIGTVLLLPVLIFKRSYSAYFLALFGPQYDVFPPAPPAPPATGLQPLAPAPPTV